MQRTLFGKRLEQPALCAGVGLGAWLMSGLGWLLFGALTVGVAGGCQRERVSPAAPATAEEINVTSSTEGRGDHPRNGWMTATLTPKPLSLGKVSFSIAVPPGFMTKQEDTVVTLWNSWGRWAGVKGPTVLIVKEGRLPSSADELANQIADDPNTSAQKQEIKNGFMVIYQAHHGGSIRVVTVTGEGDRVLRCNALYVEGTPIKRLAAAKAQLIGICKSLRIVSPEG